MTTFHSDRWTEFMNAEPRGLCVIIDEQVGKPRGQLRALSLLTELGLVHATYNPTWHSELYPVPYAYEKLSHTRSASAAAAEYGHLVQVISQETIDNSPFNFTADLIRVGLRAGPDQPLVILVCDTPKLVLSGAADGKSIFEDLGLTAKGVVPLSYQTIFRRYLRRLGSTIQQHLTDNLYFHRLAGELSRAGWTTFDRLPDLFRLQDPGFPLTPMIRALVEYFLCDPERREAVEYAKGPPFIMEEMRSWLERGEAGSVANALWFGMATFDFDMQKLLRWKGENREP